MSEYQYYEFQAIDRPLTAKEIAILRSCSTRATITSTSFVNHYEYGSFKGDEDAWMDRYFDAFMYTANWGTNVLKLRLPAEQLSLSEVQTYAAGNVLDARKKHGNVIVRFCQRSVILSPINGSVTLSPLPAFPLSLLSFHFCDGDGAPFARRFGRGSPSRLCDELGAVVHAVATVEQMPHHDVVVRQSR